MYRRALAAVVVQAILAGAFAGAARAENIDPDNDGSQYAYGENVGWINAEPGGDGGPGAHVSDGRLTGYLWGENIGWISLSCLNSSSCAVVDYGVANARGVLSGFAWAENVGWISFSCANTSSCGAVSYGVVIDPDSGVFDGRAWGENIGWITFASSGPNPYRVRTSWRCSAPAAVPMVSALPSGSDLVLSWGALPGATGYDVVRGDLRALRESGGDFTRATQGCAAEDTAVTSLTLPGDPPPGEGLWFLVRGVACANGSYDSGSATQAGSRDAEIDASSSCR